MKMEVENLLKVVVDACDDKHGYDIVAYDLTQAGVLYDYSVILSRTYKQTSRSDRSRSKRTSIRKRWRNSQHRRSKRS